MIVKKTFYIVNLFIYGNKTKLTFAFFVDLFISCIYKVCLTFNFITAFVFQLQLCWQNNVCIPNPFSILQTKLFTILLNRSIIFKFLNKFTYFIWIWEKNKHKKTVNIRKESNTLGGLSLFSFQHILELSVVLRDECQICDTFKYYVELGTFSTDTFIVYFTKVTFWCNILVIFLSEDDKSTVERII